MYIIILKRLSYIYLILRVPGCYKDIPQSFKFIEIFYKKRNSVTVELSPNKFDVGFRLYAIQESVAQICAGHVLN